MSAWKIRRGSEESDLDDARLREWAVAGRIADADYVYNPTLERWMYAKDVAEIAPLLRGKKASQQARSSCGLAILFAIVAAVVGLFVNQTLAGLVGLVALVVFIIAVVAAVKEHAASSAIVASRAVASIPVTSKSADDMPTSDSEQRDDGSPVLTLPPQRKRNLLVIVGIAALVLAALFAAILWSRVSARVSDHDEHHVAAATERAVARLPAAPPSETTTTVSEAISGVTTAEPSATTQGAATVAPQRARLTWPDSLASGHAADQQPEPSPAPPAVVDDAAVLAAHRDVARVGNLVFVEYSRVAGRVYHEPDCPSATASMSMMRLGNARSSGYTPAWDCHRPKGIVGATGGQ
ncbi:MAG TPA: hypothetical protein VJ865_04570 [Gemmatimonadaceae bacterium]|nr:hypothetical protein [Gemmatimonadaceae bacterium]